MRQPTKSILMKEGTLECKMFEDREPKMIKLAAVRTEDKELLWNINQKYLYEMTRFYDDPMDENGNYHYGYFDDYFVNPKRTAYFIYDDETLVGFAFLCPYSYINQTPDYVLAEFTIFPSFRRRGFATKAMELIFLKHKGGWEIKYNENNEPAKRLWTRITKPYKPVSHRISNEETVLSFNVA